MSELTSQTSTTHDAAADGKPGVIAHLVARWPSVIGLLALFVNVRCGLDSHVT